MPDGSMTLTGLDSAGTPLDTSRSLEDVLERARRNSLTRENPLLLDLPEWFKGFRDHQRVAIREILTAFEEGAECVVLDAPTGSGKTLIGEAVRRLLSGDGNRSSRQSTYICSSKALQDQFLRDYPYAKVLKGRSNYATERYPERFGGKEGLSCSDCTKSPGDAESCLWCSTTFACPYERAKVEALRSGLAVLNTSYFLSECNGPGQFSRGGLVIADEADVLEKELMSHVEVRISERRRKQYGLSTPRFITKEESWREWAEEAYEKVRTKGPSTGNSSTDPIKAIRERKRHDILCEKLKVLKTGLDNQDWVYTGDRQTAAFKPVTVSRLGQEKFWQHGDKFLLMSATVISGDELLESLGWADDKDWRLVKCPSTFKPENRRVVVWPVANVTRKTKEDAYPKLVEGVKVILDKHPEDRVLVHSTSYALTEMLVQSLRGGTGWLAGRPEGSEANASANDSHPSRPIFTYTESSGKDIALANYLAEPSSVLIAPSLERGVDLPGDACRVQIVCKIPFLSMDKQVTARLYSKGGSVWYAVQAIRNLVQSSGRAVRSEEDWAVTYIIDKQFETNIWANYKRLVPSWWKEGLEWRVKGL